MPAPSNQNPEPSHGAPRRLRVLISAYACEPGKGSEPGVGWNMATEMAKHHDVWVLTRANNREVIEAELERRPVDGLHFIYYDLPKWAMWWKKGGRGVQLYYYLWQRFCWSSIKAAHSTVHFDLTHHVTFGKYWVPSMLPALRIPFVWGTVGGGESMPKSFFAELSVKEKIVESVRSLARWLGEHDPAVRQTARRAAIALASTDETVVRLKKLGCWNVKIIPQCALTAGQLIRLENLPRASQGAIRFISMGRPLPWKGFYIGLSAFAKARLENAEYWIIANGKGRMSLERLVDELGIGKQVRFIDSLPTLDDVYKVLSQCHVLVHPALHEAFGNVVLEAMAAGRPVLSLDIGGPALQVDASSGFKASSTSPAIAVEKLAEAMQHVCADHDLLGRMGNAAHQQVLEHMTWRTRVVDYAKAYEFALDQ